MTVCNGCMEPIKSKSCRRCVIYYAKREDELIEKNDNLKQTIEELTKDLQCSHAESSSYENKTIELHTENNKLREIFKQIVQFVNDEQLTMYDICNEIINILKKEGVM